MAGPMVDDTVTVRRYWPLDADGLARMMASSKASALADSCVWLNERFPTGTCTLPALSTRNSTLPALASRTARPMSKVTVPSLGLGMRPRGPSTFPSRPTCPMRSGVAMAESKSSQPPCTRSTRSSAPTTSAPASRASLSFSPLANTTTRTVLPMPWGSTTAPRTIWSACFGSTPSRRERSTVSSNFARGSFSRMPMASSTPCAFSRSYTAPAAFSRFVRVGISDHLDSHAAGGAFDGPHRGLDGVGVEVHQLGLRDLPDLGAGDLADLVLVGHRRRLGDAGRPLEQDGRRRRLHHEGEGPVLVARHHHRKDEPLLVAGLGIEALAELHDVDAVLTERRAHRGRGIRLPRGDLELHHRLDFLRHVSEPFDLVVLEFHGRHASDNCHYHLELAPLGVEVVDAPLEVHEGALDHPHLVALLEGRLELRLLRALFHLAQDPLHLFGRKRHRLVAGAHEPGDLRRGAHEVPGIVGQIHLHQEVARKELLLDLDLLALPDLAHLLRGHHHPPDHLGQAEDLGPRLDGLRHLVLEPRIRMDDKPLLRLGRGSGV